MVEYERDVEQALCTMVKRHGGYCLKWVSPGQSGVPDRIVLLPGLIIFCELKRYNGKPSRLQLVWAERLRSLGFAFRFIYSKQDVTQLELEIEGRRV